MLESLILIHTLSEEANHTIDGGSTSGGDTTIIHNGTVLTLKRKYDFE